VLVPRLVLTLNGEWRDTSLQVPCGTWRNQLSGSVYSGCHLALREVLAQFPVALLVKE
jgi:(1->4)-alpha-D-glucan 1-alpha-D-glucosylmutase